MEMTDEKLKSQKLYAKINFSLYQLVISGICCSKRKLIQSLKLPTFFKRGFPVVPLSEGYSGVKDKSRPGQLGQGGSPPGAESF